MAPKHIVEIGFAFATSPNADELNKGDECWDVSVLRPNDRGREDLYGPFATIGEANETAVALIKTNEFVRGTYCKGRSDLGLS